MSWGKRLLPVVLDELAVIDPGRLYAAIAKTADPADGFRDITVADMARSVNFTARWIESLLGRSFRFDTLAFVGIPDLRGIIVWLAAVKCGYKILLLSPRNPPPTNASLMDQTGARFMLYAAEIAPMVEPLKALSPSSRFDAIPSFSEMTNSSPGLFPLDKTFEEARDDPILVLHSSGSTGLPKPIITTHGSFAALDYHRNLSDVPGRQKRDWSMWSFDGEARVYSVFPFFHCAGVITMTVNAIFYNASPVLGPPHRIPDGNLLKYVMQYNKIRALVLVPSIAEQLLGEPGGIDFFKNVDFLCYGGAPFSPDAGRRLVSVLRLVPSYAATEFFPLPELAPDPEDWEYQEFNPILKHEMRRYDLEDPIYELILFPDEGSRDFLALSHNLPNIVEFPTKDLFTRHSDPAKNLYKFYGRKDDIIVLANGEKFNPVPFEMTIQGHPSLEGAFLVGNRRDKAVLLLETSAVLDNEEKIHNFVQELWPSVEKSNALVPGQGRILDKGQILIASPGKPFARSSKNTVIRRLSEDVYKDEIEQLYTSSILHQTPRQNVELGSGPVYELDATAEFVGKILAASSTPPRTLRGDDDFFNHGLDSIQMLQFASNLRINIESQTSKTASWISPRIIYENSTINSLSRLIYKVLNSGELPEQISAESHANDAEQAVARYTRNLDRQRLTANVPSSLAHSVSNVAIVGSTGFLGTQLVAALLRTQSMARIFCLNRSENARNRQEAALLSLDAYLKPLLTKLAYMPITFGQPRLGLADGHYETLAAEVDVFILNAWRLDFGASLRSFEPFLLGTRHLVDLAALNKRRPRIVFVSSLTSVAALAQSTRGPMPEQEVDHPLAAWGGIGYAQSKLVAERILAHASKVTGIRVCIVRSGQIGGSSRPDQSTWAVQGWLSSLIQTSKALGCAPTSLMRLDWVPVDVASEVLHALTLQNSEGYYHLVCPDGEPWETFLQLLKERCGVQEKVSLPEWCRLLREMDPTTDNVKKLPILKMLSLFEAMGNGIEGVTWSVERLSTISVPSPQKVSKEMVDKWLIGWNLNDWIVPAEE